MVSIFITISLFRWVMFCLTFLCGWNRSLHSLQGRSSIYSPYCSYIIKCVLISYAVSGFEFMMGLALPVRRYLLYRFIFDHLFELVYEIFWIGLVVFGIWGDYDSIDFVQITRIVDVFLNSWRFYMLFYELSWRHLMFLDPVEYLNHQSFIF